MAGAARTAGPVLAITMGDPRGIGPEVGLRALAGRLRQRKFLPVLVGDPDVFAETAHALGIEIALVGPDSTPRRGEIVVRPTGALAARQRGFGLPQNRSTRAACGAASFAAIITAHEMVQRGEAQAIVTAPICKEHLTLAGHDFPGHTELLAELAGGVPVRMMLAGPRLRVVLVTIHVALAAVPRLLDADHIVETIRITAAGLTGRFVPGPPRIAVAGLNPHAGEGGLFGDEEARIIAPAVRRARRAGIDVVGPLAADGIFAHAAEGRYDAVVCMYHDQGLGPFKLLHFADGVNVTLGLPYVRTSPDHGTAFDIAGRGSADARSMGAAIDLAAHLTTTE